MRSIILCLICLGALSACGGGAPKPDKEEIRRNADDADRDIDRESAKHRE